MRLSSWIFPAGAAASISLLGCGGRELAGPPELRPGRDECAECGMLIHEERCAGAWLVDREGRREYLHFDDIGCMLDLQRELSPELRLLESFVHDYATRAWVESSRAFYLVTDSDQLRTPMGSGMIAFADRAAAEAAQQEFGGKVVDLGGLTEQAAPAGGP